MNATACSHHRKFQKRSDQHLFRGSFFGLAIMMVGIAYLLNHFNLLGGYRPSQLWPALFIVWGLFKVAIPIHRGERFWGSLIILVSIMALLHSLGVAAVPWSLMWPIFLMVAGLYVILSIFKARRKRASQAAEFAKTGGDFDARVVMGEKEERFSETPFTGGRLDVAMGSYFLDLRRAEFPEEHAHLWVKLFMGEVIVRVPTGINLVIDGRQTMGSIENDIAGKRAHENRPTLTIHAEVLFGSLKVN